METTPEKRSLTTEQFTQAARIIDTVIGAIMGAKNLFKKEWVTPEELLKQVNFIHKHNYGEISMDDLLAIINACAMLFLIKYKEDRKIISEIKFA
jgi:hypothetical protein